MKNEILIRPIEAKDKTEYIQMATIFYTMPCCDHNVPAKHFENAFEFCLAKDNPYCRIFMLEVSGKIAGYGSISFTYSIEAGGKVVLLEELFIKPQFQNQGLGKAFFNYVQTNYPAKRFRLEVTKSNTRAAKLYKSLGYKELSYIQMIKDEN